MIRKEKLLHIIHHYCKQLGKHSRKMEKDLDEDAIHEFRVSAKRLRSFLRMLRLKAKYPEELKYPKSFKKVYSTVGKVRDRQLCIKRIHEVDKGYQGSRIHSLEKEIKELANKKSRFLHQKDLDRMENNLGRHLQAMPEIVVRDFIEERLSSIRQTVSSGDFSDTGLHSIRKCLKDIYYIVAIYNDELKTRMPFSFWNTEDATKAEELTDSLGRFNDTGIALSLLTPQEIRKTPVGERNSLRSIRRKWLRDKKSLKVDVLRKLSELNMTTVAAQ